MTDHNERAMLREKANEYRQLGDQRVMEGKDTQADAAYLVAHYADQDARRL